MKLGNLSRGGKNRKETHADDHDFGVTGTVTPVAIYLPNEKDLFFYMVRSKTTSDCYVDILESWWDGTSQKFSEIKRLVINLDNGPEQSSSRTQFMKRIQEFADTKGIEVQLAYFPPYHSKYNPVERTLGALELYWSGEILDTEDKVVGYAKSMTWAEKNPVVNVVKKTYKTGVRLTKAAMKKLNSGFDRKKGIEKWSVIVRPKTGFG